jgi:uncharacterized protein
MRRLTATLAALSVLTLAAVAGRAEARPTDIDDPDEVVLVTAGALNTYWSGVFTRLRKPYAKPKAIHWYFGPTMTACGLASMGNAFYCTLDRSIYLDYFLLHRYVVVQDADFAAAAILAHEWGHYVQHRRGYLGLARMYGFYVGKELQADCYAGLFARYAQQRGMLDPGDLAEGAELMISIGDEPGVSRDDEQAHGTPSERLGWFMIGYGSGDLRRCDSVYALIYGSG